MKADRWDDHFGGGHFNPRIFMVPALAFFGGAVVGRIFGLRGLMRGAVAALALGSAGRKLLHKPEPHVRTRKPIRRALNRRAAQKRSPARRRG
jgi:hypothetical protein